jgi:hypothetical protein
MKNFRDIQAHEGPSPSELRLYKCGDPNLPQNSRWSFLSLASSLSAGLQERLLFLLTSRLLRLYLQHFVYHEVFYCSSGSTLLLSTCNQQ